MIGAIVVSLEVLDQWLNEALQGYPHAMFHRSEGGWCVHLEGDLGKAPTRAEGLFEAIGSALAGPDPRNN